MNAITKQYAIRRTIAVACGSAFASTTPLADAQQEAAETRGSLKVEVTGSHLKRTETETALPVQIIDRTEIERAGWTTAAELIAHVSANFNGMNAQLSLGQSANPGLASANLRGLGDGSTLVLLNGRRLANYAFFSGTADLNSIPLAAIERVEVLKDGASSVYGTDAIAGVVNFILRRDYRGVEVAGQIGETQHGGANHYQGTITAGWGDLAKDRFNAFVSVDWQKDTALAARDRPFSRTAYLPGLGVNKLSFNTFPANIIYRDERGGAHFANPTYASGCAPPVSIPLVRRGDQLCAFDYASVIDIVPPSERTNVVARATYQVAANHQLFAEYGYSYNKLRLAVSPSPAVEFFTTQGQPIPYPAGGPFYPTAFAASLGITGDLSLATRTVPLGPRTDEVRAEAHRLVLGAEGILGGWDYNVAYNHSEDQAIDTFTSGLVSEQRFIAAMATGLINPFGPSAPEGDALLASTQISGEVRRAKGTTDQLDARLSREIFMLPGGALAVALGAEARREALKDTPGTSFNLGDVLGGGGAIEPQDASRRVQAAFVEFAVPIHKTLEALVSARYDHYSDFGGTTNPKVALRWQPVRSLLLRGSWGTGFRAPTLPDLFTPVVEGFSDSDKGDALRCPVTQLPSDCDLLAFRVRNGGNRALQPEHSEQATAGIVWEAANGVSIGIDYWKIRKTGVINTLTDDLILDHLDVYGSTNVLRGPPDPTYPGLPGPIQTLIEWNQNVGDRRTSGFDVDLRARSPVTSFGRLSLGLQGTYIVDWTDHLKGLPAESSVARYSAFGPIPRWRHYATFDWEYGPWGATLAQTYQTGYVDQNPDANIAPRRVGSYQVWDLQGTYTGWRSTKIALGVRNLLDRAPPFTNQVDTFQVGYDPRYADPRGRWFYARVTYAFK